MDWLWVFHGSKGELSSAIFSDKSKAEAWIKKYALCGMLTKMPIDKSVYDWALESGVFAPKRAYQTSAKFIQCFTSAHLEHYHYKDGEEQ